MGEAFPDFALRALDGAAWTRADLLGDRTVLFCFASW
jgi:peroxiredoxin